MTIKRSSLRIALAALVAFMTAGASVEASCYALDGGITLSPLQPRPGSEFTVNVTPSEQEPCPDGLTIRVTLSRTSGTPGEIGFKNAICADGVASASFLTPTIAADYRVTATVPAELGFCAGELTLNFTVAPSGEIDVVSPDPDLPPNTVLVGDMIELVCLACTAGETVTFTWPISDTRSSVVPQTFTAPCVDGIAQVEVPAPDVPGRYQATIELEDETIITTGFITVIEPVPPVTTTPETTTPVTTTPVTTTPVTTTPVTTVAPPPTTGPPVTSVPRVGTTLLPASTSFGLLALVTGGALVLVARARRHRPAALRGPSGPLPPPSAPSA